tara:strand:+ start:7960 stop:8094 length:135 start_codon:yes stop_codon:yes gene_type:complete
VTYLLRWSVQYESGWKQSLRLGERDRADELELKKAARPASHRRD